VVGESGLPASLRAPPGRTRAEQTEGLFQAQPVAGQSVRARGRSLLCTGWAIGFWIDATVAGPFPRL
jgi:hypothetical protein